MARAPAVTPGQQWAWRHCRAASRWRSTENLKSRKRPVTGVGVPRPRVPHVHQGFVVLSQFTFPAGLYGGNSATFFVPKGVRRPTGNPGHSARSGRAGSLLPDLEELPAVVHD